MKNEPAFPECWTKVTEDRKTLQVTYQRGMTLRDYFAGRAMDSILKGKVAGLEYEKALELIAITAYQIADAMLKEREKEVKDE